MKSRKESMDCVAASAPCNDITHSAISPSNGVSYPSLREAVGRVAAEASRVGRCAPRIATGIGMR